MIRAVGERTVPASRGAFLRSARIPIALSAMIAAALFLRWPLRVEDGYILFNRANNVEGDIFFSYSGYISAHPQLIAKVSASLPPFFQAIIYAVFAFILWTIFLYYIVQASKFSWPAYVLISWFVIFEYYFVINLTYSHWTALVVLGLMGVTCIIERRELTVFEAGFAAVLAFASPLSVLTAPIFLWLSVSAYWASRSPLRPLAVMAAVVLAALILPDKARPESDPGALVALFSSNLRFLLEDPRAFFDISAGQFAVSPARLIQWSSFVFVSVFVLAAAFLWRSDTPVVPIAVAAVSGPIVILLALATNPAPLASRYFSPALFLVR